MDTKEIKIGKFCIIEQISSKESWYNEEKADDDSSSVYIIDHSKYYKRFQVLNFKNEAELLDDIINRIDNPRADGDETGGYQTDILAIYIENELHSLEDTELLAREREIKNFHGD